MTSRITLIVFLPLLLAGCVQAELTTNILQDGSGSVEIELAYRSASWPGFLGDPLVSFDSAHELYSLTGPGFVAWSKPEITIADGVRHYRTEVFFDDITEVRFLAGRKENKREVLRFDRVNDRSLRLTHALNEILKRPLPLPSPERVGMREVSISPALLDGIRKQIGPVIKGLTLEFNVVMPGDVTRADGLETTAGHRASVFIDHERATRAFTDSAGLLIDAEKLLTDDARWEWSEPTNESNMAAELRTRSAAAKKWWASKVGQFGS